MEEYAKEALQRMRQGSGKADFGYDEFKRREDEKRRRRSDELEYQKWRDRFRHLDDESDGLN
jgi:23S rRNA G2069 N7-methylase RlmK/C1962 C5-methylase RlmI